MCKGMHWVKDYAGCVRVCRGERVSKVMEDVKDLEGVQGFARCAKMCKGIQGVQGCARGRIVCK